MGMSPAERMQLAVLRIASQTGDGLDLSKVSGQHAVVDTLPEGSLKAGDRVLVIGATSDISYQAARLVGPTGSIVAVESDTSHLQRVLEQESAFEQQLGTTNWSFVQAELDDLRTRSDFLSGVLTENPVQDLQDYRELQVKLEQQRRDNPLIADESIDVVILDSVTNRLPDARLRIALSEAFRVLRRGGKVIALSLLADESGVPVSLPTLPNGLSVCNAPLETEIIALLNEAGYYGMSYKWRAELPMKVVEGVELRSFVVEAYKGKQGVCLDLGHAVVYNGPWSEVHDDDGHRYVRGERTAVCEKTYNILMREPYAGQLTGIPCYTSIPASQAPLFDCNTPQLRDPQVTKGKKSLFDQESCCTPSTDGGGCC